MQTCTYTSKEQTSGKRRAKEMCQHVMVPICCSAPSAMTPPVSEGINANLPDAGLCFQDFLTSSSTGSASNQHSSGERSSKGGLDPAQPFQTIYLAIFAEMPACTKKSDIKIPSQAAAALPLLDYAPLLSAGFNNNMTGAATCAGLPSSPRSCSVSSWKYPTGILPSASAEWPAPVLL